MATRHILILGGTGDARKLAERLHGRDGLRVTLSLAGRTVAPLLPAVGIRIGGFGGAAKLADWLHDHSVDVLIDATHPFAAQITANAVAAAQQAGVQLLRLERPQWQRMTGDQWIEVDNVDGAVRALGATPRTVFVAVGRQELAPFLTAPQHHYVVRSVDAVDEKFRVAGARYILERGPFDEAAEQRLFEMEKIEAVVTKNSGGAATYGKIAAARSLGIPVMMVRRPPAPQAPAYAAVDELIAALDHLIGRPAERGE